MKFRMAFVAPSSRAFGRGELVTGPNEITMRQGTYIFQEGDPANEMLFIIRGQVESSTSTGGCFGFFNSITFRQGDFYAEDLKFVAIQFKHLHSMKLQHVFRYYSHQWRAWGACFMQAAWRRYKKKNKLALQENDHSGDEINEDWSIDSHVQHLGAMILASKFAANTRRGATQRAQIADTASSSLKMSKLFKPDEPGFSEEFSWFVRCRIGKGKA
ncbi:hypothetical protein CDL12_21102 [Handroanthus impetiginosus]|uniref:Cyclic nucleotide-binding domain-containing protein n=1 Tax=Handroanthus impetiginosus TaxID=429701 RepID=A0A2G9GM65_9LAMI|nr:hypothetical protein CDL12_21102 [Handroanthus impetiginosus]